MSQRQLRLGDILDDYCPRERRLTNHVIVAMVDQEVKQTRCTTCEAEHEYKGARVPPQRRKKAAPGALYQEVLGGLPRKTPPQAASGASSPASDDLSEPPLPVLEPEPEAPVAAIEPEEDSVPVAAAAEEGPVHRPLIRATLPRPEGQAPVRQAPEFTMRQPLPRPGRFRPGRPGRPGGGGPDAAGFRFNGRRGHPISPEAARQAHGNRIRPVQGEQRQGQGGSRRRGKKRSK